MHGMQSNSRRRQTALFCLLTISFCAGAASLARASESVPAASNTGAAPSSASLVEPGPPPMPADCTGRDAVKQYVLVVTASALSGANDLKHDGGLYADLVASHGSAVAAAQTEPERTALLIRSMRNDYKRIDSFGYEYMEGIVAGVPALIKYDVLLDSGVPEVGAGPQDAIPDIHIKAGNVDINREGSLNNWLIEPTVYGTNPKFVVGKAKLPGLAGSGYSAATSEVNLPNPQLVLALADYAVDGYTKLQNDTIAWQPSDRDLFLAMVNMTPTLADYFDEWKESKKYGQALGGRFVAVSRVSDMRGIMSSTRLTWLAAKSLIDPKDTALSKKISSGYEQIMHFIDTIDDREHKRPLKVETIDALGTQAKERADKLTVQDGQAASLLGLDVASK